jgi:hypothetical protein
MRKNIAMRGPFKSSQPYTHTHITAHTHAHDHAPRTRPPPPPRRPPTHTQPHTHTQLFQQHENKPVKPDTSRHCSGAAVVDVATKALLPVPVVIVASNNNIRVKLFNK